MQRDRVKEIVDLVEDFNKLRSDITVTLEIGGTRDAHDPICHDISIFEGTVTTVYFAELKPTWDDVPRMRSIYDPDFEMAEVHMRRVINELMKGVGANDTV